MSKKVDNSEFVSGTHVEVPSLKRRGIVRRGPNHKQEYGVEMGDITIWVHVSLLKVIGEPKSKKKDDRAEASRRGIAAQRATMARSSSTHSQNRCPAIDLHGLTQAEAIERLEVFLDRALLSGADAIEIIHGIGSGALKSCVTRYLTEAKNVASFQMLPNNPGTTIAYLC